MFVRFSFIIFLIIQSLRAAGIVHAPAAGPHGPECFSYEVFSHQNPPPRTLNMALVSYGHEEITGRNALINPLPRPPAAVPILPYDIGLSFMSHTFPPTLWQHANIPVPGGPLDFQEACQMVMERALIGVRTRFQHPEIIAFIAAGFPIAAIGGMVGMAPALIINYLQRALGGGGYLVPLSAAIFRVRHNIPPLNFAHLVPAPPPAPIPGTYNLITHIRNNEEIRVSKNLKELSYNSLLAFVIPGVPAMPGLPPALAGLVPPGPYVTIKDMINAQFIALGLPVPHSAMIVSSDFIQPD